jgi:cytidine deaminase
MLEAAREASRRAYAPYSRLRVGAALLGASGRISAGANVENASFGLTICAERVALFSAIAAGERQFLGVVIYSGAREPLLPCGACRQALAEFCGPTLAIRSLGSSGKKKERTLGKLLPEVFRFLPG